MKIGHDDKLLEILCVSALLLVPGLLGYNFIRLLQSDFLHYELLLPVFGGFLAFLLELTLAVFLIFYVFFVAYLLGKGMDSILRRPHL